MTRQMARWMPTGDRPMKAAHADAASSTRGGDIPGAPVMPSVVQNAVKPKAPVECVVRASRICTRSRKASGFVRHIEIDVSGTPLEGAWVAGQSFGVIPPGGDERGTSHKLRLYSIAAPTGGETGDGTILSTTTKRLIDEDWESHQLRLGVCSNYLCDLREGDTVQITGPAGKRFVLPSDPGAHDYLFFATGTGIAPFRGMVMDLANASMPSRVDLVMGSPYETDLLYDDDLNAIHNRFPDRFRYRTAISRHTTPDQPGGMYIQDRLEHDADELAPRLRDERTLVYVCGIAGMELGIFRAMARMLDPETLSHYLSIDPDIAQDPDAWERGMIPRRIKPTSRMMLEVY